MLVSTRIKCVAKSKKRKIEFYSYKETFKALQSFLVNTKCFKYKSKQNC